MCALDKVMKFFLFFFFFVFKLGIFSFKDQLNKLDTVQLGAGWGRPPLWVHSSRQAFKNKNQSFPQNAAESSRIPFHSHLLYSVRYLFLKDKNRTDTSAPPPILLVTGYLSYSVSYQRYNVYNHKRKPGTREASSPTPTANKCYKGDASNSCSCTGLPDRRYELLWTSPGNSWPRGKGWSL